MQKQQRPRLSTNRVVREQDLPTCKKTPFRSCPITLQAKNWYSLKCLKVKLQCKAAVVEKCHCVMELPTTVRWSSIDDEL